MIEKKYDKDKPQIFVIEDKPMNMILLLSFLFLLDIILFSMGKVKPIDFFLFALPLFLGSLFLKKTTTTINKENGDTKIVTQNLIISKVYNLNIFKEPILLSYGQGAYKHNGVVMIGKIPINTPDINRPYPNDLKTLFNDKKKLKKQ
jgi:hypothetical protein